MKNMTRPILPSTSGGLIARVLSFPKIFCIAVLFITAVFPVSAPAAQPLKKASFLPQWSPQAQFAGFYVALEMGFYERQGIELEILPGGPECPPSRMLTDARVDFTTMFLSTALELRSRGVPVINVAQLAQISALMLVAHKDSGIQSPGDFQGRKVSVWPEFRLQAITFFNRHNVRVAEVVQGYTVNLFLRGGVDAASAMWYNEYKTILDSGMDEDELTTFLLSDYGVNFPEDGIYCRLSTLEKDPELVRGFVRASLQGWQYAFDHPEKALDVIMRRVDAAHLPSNRVHQKWMLDRMEDIMRPAGRNISMGGLSREDFEFTAQKLFDAGIIKSSPDYDDFHKPTEE